MREGDTVIGCSLFCWSHCSPTLTERHLGFATCREAQGQRIRAESFIKREHRRRPLHQTKNHHCSQCGFQQHTVSVFTPLLVAVVYNIKVNAVHFLHSIHPASAYMCFLLLAIYKARNFDFTFLSQARPETSLDTEHLWKKTHVTI